MHLQIQFELHSNKQCHVFIRGVTENSQLLDYKPISCDVNDIVDNITGPTCFIPKELPPVLHINIKPIILDDWLTKNYRGSLVVERSLCTQYTWVQFACQIKLTTLKAAFRNLLFGV